VSATSHGAGCGVVLGIVIVLFLQQIAVYSLSDFGPALEYLIIGAVVGGVLGAVLGWVLGRSYLSRHAVAEATSAKK